MYDSVGKAMFWTALVVGAIAACIGFLIGRVA